MTLSNKQKRAKGIPTELWELREREIEQGMAALLELARNPREYAYIGPISHHYSTLTVATICEMDIWPLVGRSGK